MKKIIESLLSYTSCNKLSYFFRTHCDQAIVTIVEVLSADSSLEINDILRRELRLVEGQTKKSGDNNKETKSGYLRALEQALLAIDRIEMQPSTPEQSLSNAW